MAINYVIVHPTNFQIQENHSDTQENHSLSDTSFSCAQCLTERCAEFLWSTLRKILIKIAILIIIILIWAMYAAWKDIQQYIKNKLQ